MNESEDPVAAPTQSAAAVEALAAAAPVAPGASAEVMPFTFTGRTSEYFRIWAVSLALSILTLGVYSAWGKVRKKRYLCHHMRLAGDGFDFRGSPLAVLRGRVIAVVLLGGIALGSHLMVEIQVAFIVLLVLLTPWIAVASARFNARNTYYRNIAFDFDGRLGAAIKVFLGFGALALVTLGLAYPWFRATRARFLVTGHRYGATPFVARIGTGEFVLVYLLAAVAVVGCAAAFGFASALLFTAHRGAASDRGSSTGFLVALGLFYASYFVVFAFVRARTQNLIANGTLVGPLRLQSELRGARLSWLYLTNAIVVVATLALATPWAVMRLARYRARTLTLLASAPLATLAGASPGNATATGAEVSDLFDVDVAL
ncbi:MAG TPA: YjgN family protein [Casimicrobiaceae bacterium]|nr:YjgN family protein [Casimicrobiaceae bacterium]